MKDTYHVDPAVVDAIAERMDELRAAVTISEAEMRRLRQACEAVVAILRTALAGDTGEGEK